MIRAAALALGCLAASPAAAQSCRQALALGLDVSGSVDAREYRLQIDGLAAALDDPEVRSALLAVAGARVRVAVYEWSGPDYQRLVLPWSEFAGQGDIDAAVARLRSTTRGAGGDPSTALGVAMGHGARLLASQTDCLRLTLDISGDGRSNTGPRPQDIGPAEVPPDITLNALAIWVPGTGDGFAGAGDTGDLAGYFEAWVIRGPGAFVESAQGFDDYAAAMKRKLLRELSGLVIGAVAPAAPDEAM